MALEVQCENGHIYIQGDIYIDSPETKTAPRCPACFLQWARKNKYPITATHTENAQKVIQETKLRKHYAKASQERRNVLEQHRKIHRNLPKHFQYCPECGERLA